MKQNDSKIHGPAVLTGKFIKICLPQEAKKKKTKNKQTKNHPNTKPDLIPKVIRKSTATTHKVRVEIK